jgi:bifunctional DNA-binding transcriptional regulator/antitoxin component of YhaV-PrlF toxin-antitoxin module
MKTKISTLTGNGTATIPVDVRRHLGVKEHDKLAFIIEDDGAVRVRALKYPTIASLRGAAGTLDRPMSWDEMRNIAREDALLDEYLPRE